LHQPKRTRNRPSSFSPGCPVVTLQQTEGEGEH
jgi:hypothetical protein